MKRLFVVIALVISLAGCATGEKMVSLKPGMSKAQAESILGRPDGIEASGSQEAYKYSSRLTSSWYWDRSDYVLLFDNNKLVKYGPGSIYARVFRSGPQNIDIGWQ
jgi:outer membrane protein assembly factor BamE (lipoprotein component of BamABCDE complex)